MPFHWQQNNACGENGGVAQFEFLPFLSGSIISTKQQLHIKLFGVELPPVTTETWLIKRNIPNALVLKYRWLRSGT